LLFGRLAGGGAVEVDKGPGQGKDDGLVFRYPQAALPPVPGV
jgi:hypothetical protein